MDLEVEERSWSNLPEDILDMICLLVSKQSPYLLALDDIKCKFYHPVFENTYYENFPNTSDCRIASTNFGWLLVNAGNCWLSFINPFTREGLITVPTMLDYDKFQIFHFSSRPTSSDCTIIAMKNDNIDDTYIGIIKRGEKNWNFIRFNDCGFKTSFCNSVFFDGRYYFMGDKFNIGIFDVKTNDWKICDKHLIPLRKRYLYRPVGMAEDNCGILVVYESREHQQLYVARFDTSKMTWENVDCLGDDKVLYVSECASYLETVAAKEMGNKIYFPKFYGASGVFYSLDTKKYHSRDGKYCSEGPYGISESRFCTWIKPNYSKDIVGEDLDDLNKISF